MNPIGSIQQEIEKWQYISHWVSLEDIAKACSSKRPYKKLKRFSEKSFTKKHEASFNRIYLQKIILTAVAVQLKLKLYTSVNFYERDGLIFGIYKYQYPEFESSRRIGGIELIEELTDPSLRCIGKGSNFLWFDSDIEKMKAYILENQLAKIGEYVIWIKEIISYLQDRNAEFTPYSFLSLLQKLPLSEHYVFKVKLENAMLMPIFIENPDLKQSYRETIIKEKQIIEQIFQKNDIEFQEKFKELGALFEDIYKTLFEHEVVGEADEGPPFFKELTSKMKSKEAFSTISKKFVIILSRFRGITETNEKPIEDSQQPKDSKACTKIEIKARNGLIEPISGNVIFVKLSWSISQQEKQTKLLLQCCNNRKVQEMYYEEVYSFWEKLENNQKFRELLGVDKFLVSLNQDSENLEVVLSNYVSSCLLTSFLKEVDKIVVLTLVLDEVIELCERKGNERQETKNFNIEPYMIDHAIMRYEKALIEVQNRYHLLYENMFSYVQNPSQ